MFTYRPIGVIRSPHTRADRTPIQPVYAAGAVGRVELVPEYADGLQDLDGFSHIHLLYVFDRAGPPQLLVRPFLDDQPRGVFATRAPCRPNAIGISLVRLVRRHGPVLDIEDVDVLDGTPLLDIKPYVTRFDVRADARCGWQDAVDPKTAAEQGRRGYTG